MSQYCFHFLVYWWGWVELELYIESLIKEKTEFLPPWEVLIESYAVCDPSKMSKAGEHFDVNACWSVISRRAKHWDDALNLWKLKNLRGWAQHMHMTLARLQYCLFNHDTRLAWVDREVEKMIEWQEGLRQLEPAIRWCIGDWM